MLLEAWGYLACADSPECQACWPETGHVHAAQQMVSVTCQLWVEGWGSAVRHHATPPPRKASWSLSWGTPQCLDWGWGDADPDPGPLHGDAERGGCSRPGMQRGHGVGRTHPGEVGRRWDQASSVVPSPSLTKDRFKDKRENSKMATTGIKFRAWSLLSGGREAKVLHKSPAGFLLGDPTARDLTSFPALSFLTYTTLQQVTWGSLSLGFLICKRGMIIIFAW